MSIKAPMAGKIINVLVQEGEKVEKGQPVLVLEAMKMENDLVAPQDGTVQLVLVKEGQSVKGGEELVQLA
ncbi:biotin/lipoyl-containing protein [Desulfosporosinus sp.]|uniref:biotin/lipoyl-containing protein n=1 Tax=Desulfosporosinus sp. TaxID=157907 RepID=UPI00230B366F|nr:biotin/lipoyl-containing protein [Desulfosporosinus sp.]MCO5384500.1 biotin/lipoyl-binding protein [Desulfosporosinus sp.]MDA8223089.1 biotin/lipoyl-binding protein [Desulfitobacterium hafniense]